MWPHLRLWGHGEQLGDRWSRHDDLGNQERFRPNHRDKEMSEEDDPVPLIRGRGKDPPFTFALAVKKFPYLCRLLKGRSYLWVFLIYLLSLPHFFLTNGLSRFGILAAALLRVSLMLTLMCSVFGRVPNEFNDLWTCRFVALMTLMMCYGTPLATAAPSTTALWKDDPRPRELYKCDARSLAEGAYRSLIWPMLPSIQLKFKVLSGVPIPSLSFTHTILTVGCDPTNVIQMSCIMGATALIEEAFEHCWREHPLYEDGGYRNNGLTQTGAGRIKLQYWEFFFPTCKLIFKVSQQDIVS